MPDSGIALQIGFLTVRWYSVLIVSGMVLAVLLSAWAAKKRGLSVDELLNMVLLIIPCGIIGARLYYVVLMWDALYVHNPVVAFQIWRGGLAIHGGIIGGIVALLIYCRVRRQPFFAWADILIPGVVLAQAIGRWGNFFNQEAYGYITDLPWAMYIDGALRHPTFLYESLWNFSCFFLLILLAFRWKSRKDGNLLAFYFIYYSIGRFIVECFRTDSLMLGGEKAVSMALIVKDAIAKGDITLLWAQGIPAALVISLIGIALGAAILLWNKKHGHAAVPLKRERALPRAQSNVKKAAANGKKSGSQKNAARKNGKKKKKH